MANEIITLNLDSDIGPELPPDEPTCIYLNLYSDVERRVHDSSEGSEPSSDPGRNSQPFGDRIACSKTQYERQRYKAQGHRIVAEARTADYAICRKSDGCEYTQIKGCSYGNTAKPGQRLGRIKLGAHCHSVLMVLPNTGCASRGFDRSRFQAAEGR